MNKREGMNRREVGERFEKRACAYMTERGFVVLERNFRCRQGEIDVVGEEEGYLVFAEGKYRASGISGNPAEAVTAAKQRKICRVADYYRHCHGIGDGRAVRYDVVAIEGIGEAERIVWLKNAFDHIYGERRTGGRM